MYDNIYIQAQNLRRPDNIRPGGLCKIYGFKIEDVASWPGMDPEFGVIRNQVLLKEGGTLYIIEPTEKEKTFTEEEKTDAKGDYMDMNVITNLAGNTVTNHLGIQAFMFSQVGLIIRDKDGIQRLIGNKDAGCKLVHGFTSGNTNTSRGRTLQWHYEHPLPAPIYNGGLITLDGNGSIFTSLVLVARFRVGNPGAPMVDGDTVYTNIFLKNKQFVWLADGKAIHQMDDDPGQRYCIKDFVSDTINVHGGVTHGEVMEIYIF